jgi:hypothetical protein
MTRREGSCAVADSPIFAASISFLIAVIFQEAETGSGSAISDNHRNLVQDHTA